MSLDIDMKMILLLNCSDSHFDSVIIFGISLRIPNVTNPGKIPLELHRSPVDSTQNL